jgi:sugar phosphate isomerase/epimerase
MRIGTTSYIIPDDILPNVHYLKDKVDDIELVLFESEDMSNLPSKETIKTLKNIGSESDLSYTVHFPLDIFPGSDSRRERTAFVDTLQKIIELCTDLDPFGYVLHLTPQIYGQEPAKNIDSWLENLQSSLQQFFEITSLDSRMLCVETLSYPFELVQPLVEQFDLSVTLDIGHIWLMGYDAERAVRSLLGRTRICHLHGVANNHDHLSLRQADDALIEHFLHALVEQCKKDEIERVLTLEVFSEEAFSASLSRLQESRAMIHWHWGGKHGNHR